ncbi:RluA family pseudouridine synthase [Saprospiraceae bacterium]|nr:RluA family pseudouridine synthase [Saprospiraceae bacterium]
MKEASNENAENENNDVYEHYRFHVDGKQTSVRLDKYLIDNKLEKISRNRLQNAIKNGYVLVNDKPIKSNYKVRPLDVIVINLPEEPRERTSIVGEDIPLDIRYEDDDVIIVHKPAGLVVHPGVGNWSGTLVNGLVYYMENKDLPVMEGNTPDRPGLVHRIDKNTSGLLVIAKNEYAMTHLSKQFHDHTIDRVYHAIVWGQPEPDADVIDEFIGRHPTDRIKMNVFNDRDQGRNAVTHYKVIEPMYYVSLVECKLETGRTHQIRVHLSHRNHPLFNDTMYGGDRVVKGTVFSKYKTFVENTFKLMPRHGLHAKSLGFIHPTSGEYMNFESELPQDMEDVLEKWRHYVTHQKSRQL